MYQHLVSRDVLFLAKSLLSIAEIEHMSIYEGWHVSNEK